jgi:hypothetical protein
MPPKNRGGRGGRGGRKRLGPRLSSTVVTKEQMEEQVSLLSDDEPPHKQDPKPKVNILEKCTIFGFRNYFVNDKIIHFYIDCVMG